MLKSCLALVLSCILPIAVSALVHPGMLHTADDFTRVISKVDAGTEPWQSGWAKLTANAHAQANYTMQGPVASVIRGADSTAGAENYATLFNDAAAAYQLALRWKISGDTTFAVASGKILDAWSATLKEIAAGSSDMYLASGIYGYQLANAAEILRAYSPWGEAGAASVGAMLLSVFYPRNIEFLDLHNGQEWYHYRANWDLANMATALSIGILTDNQTIYDEALARFTTTSGTGNINHFIWQTYEEAGSGKRLGQNEESGRDQGHATLDFSLVGAYAQMAYNQGDDIFAYNDSQILAGSEYTAKYNLGYSVPYTPHIVPDYNELVISNSSRGTLRPEWELLFAHYDGIKGLNASWTGGMRDLVDVEGGGGDYGPNSSGYDQLGLGTLMYRLK